MEYSIEYQTTTRGLILRNVAVNLIVGTVLFSCALLAEFCITIIVSLICMVVFYSLIFFYRPIIYFKYFHFIFGSSIAIAGCAVIELLKVDLWEISDYSAFNGALPLLTFSWWAFLSTVMLHDAWLSEKLSYRRDKLSLAFRDTFSSNSENKGYFITIATCTGCILIVYTFAVVFRNPSFIIGVDRFKYSLMFDYGLLYEQANRFIRYLLIICIVASIYTKNRIGWLALIVYCMHSFWTGNKFGSFFSLLCTFLMIYSTRIEPVIMKKKRVIISVGLLTCILIGFAVFGVSFTRDEGTSGYLVSRLAQQGQLWWKTYGTTDTIHINEFGDEVASIKKGTTDIKENVGARYGIYKIMYYTTPKSQVDAKLKSGSRYTAAGFAAAYYYLGMPGCILFAVIGGILTSVFVNYFLFFLRYNQFIRAFIHLRLYTNMTVFMGMFLFFPFFNKTSVLSYVILLLGHNKIFKYGKEQV
ncbi:MAG: hypothetical protein IKE74_04540 [Mogibacterium sp.]|nr:hypothetical protein [Mogibacterium sp.]